MKCPVCKTPNLLMTERQSIEIDYCPSCRGVWLDRGELDKLVAQVETTPARGDDRQNAAAHDHHRARPHHDSDRRYDDRHRDDYRHDSRYGQSGYRKKRSLFDMFDFD
ncbi:zf-TFIIB domain-containing protein [Paraburkholderia edwinii]|uniref:Zf-TFIIB domain-containing protein n=1 Tax=Paraburkholderia edwinii TaxID=2861782 RepID=A0ABX8UGE7_9BURK|nr:zf-TFIIB domain-containing protein [Paraburkholderia edwinii]QYD67967.1 zf-TFIIB domain-containing protein [Paraburkholderia edwinii]